MNAPAPLGTPKNEGWVLYDGACGVCTRGIKRWERTLTRSGFACAPLQAPWVQERLGLSPANLLDDVRLLTSKGQILAGVDVYLFLARRIWWALPLAWLARLPGCHFLLGRAYRWIARHRYGIQTACPLPHASPSSGWQGWLPLAALSLLVLLCLPLLPPWVFMWALAFSIYAGCKWLTLWTARSEVKDAGRYRVLGYLFLWPGMDASEFFRRDVQSPMPRASEWLAAAFKTALGVGLLWGLARLFWPRHAEGAAWTGMLGYILLLHCGLFHLLSLAWRRVGVDARPIMNAPLRAASLKDFWGFRWNRAFRQLAERFLFRPLQPGLGVAGAVLCTYLVSGLVHELLISLPAGAGWGLPTGYFLLQGAGLLAARSAWGKRWGLERGVAGRAFLFLLTAAPVYGLFHPPFVERVVIPFFRAIGAL